MKFSILAATILALFLTLDVTDTFAAKKIPSSNRITSDEPRTQIDYVRTNIVLLRKSMPKPTPHPIPLQDGSQDKSIMPPEEDSPEVENPALVFDVEIRDGMSLYNQSGWFNLSSYSDKSGVMMAFSKPDIKPIIRSTQYSPVDILFIDKQGNVTQIAPNILLSELEDDINPSAPILAYLFLKGGICEQLNINVGDEVQYSLFKKPPLILNSPPPKETPKEPPVETKPIILTPQTTKLME